MRIAELLFLVLLVLYHAFLLLPRHRRPFALNYLVFLSGIALGVSLGLEGLRWQMWPSIVLLLLDLLVLFPTFATLRGRLPSAGFWFALGRFVRTLIASISFLTATAGLALTVLLPLPQVPMSGGLPVSLRTVSFAAKNALPALDVFVWYPASGNSQPLPRPQVLPSSWRETADAGGLPSYWQTYLEHLPSSMIRGGKLSRPGNLYPVVLFAAPAGENPLDFGWLLEDLASRGFVVMSARSAQPAALPPPFSWTELQNQLWAAAARPELWLQPDAKWEASTPKSPWALVKHLRTVLADLSQEPGDLLFGAVDMHRVGLLTWRAQPAGKAEAAQVDGLAGVVWLGDQPKGPSATAVPELWVTASPTASDSALNSRRWVLLLDSLKRADVTDSAYLKPYLAFFGLKSQADGSTHALLREYLAAFFQFTLWGGDGSLFEQSASPVAGVRILHQ